METQVEHMLALKVMRVTRPTLINFGNSIFTEKSDLLQFDLKNNFVPDQQFLQLPQAFGNIYLGETFSSYICVHNCTTHPVNSVSVKCDLQSNSSRVSIPIHANKTIPTSLNQNETLDDVIHYEVKEIGTHILVCEVNYISPSGIPLSFRKFFKFQVLKPLDLTTKFYTSENDVVLLEATVRKFIIIIDLKFLVNFN
jgi:trafficking protein particle complex subunit 13